MAGLDDLVDAEKTKARVATGRIVRRPPQLFGSWIPCAVTRDCETTALDRCGSDQDLLPTDNATGPRQRSQAGHPLADL